MKKSKAGLRSEEIKKALGLDVREVPRILKTGVAAKKLKATGQKRATVYSVADGGPAAGPAPKKKAARKSKRAAKK